MGYRKYSDEFKREVLVMAAEGSRSIAQIERELDITAGLIYKWQQRYRVQANRLEPSEERAEQAELRRLRRELAIVKQERDILKKPSRYFHGGKRKPLPLHR